MSEEAPVVQETPQAETVDSSRQNNVEQAPTAQPEAKPEEVKPVKEETTPEQAAKREGRRFERRLDKAYKRAAEAEARARLAEERYQELSKPKAAEGEPTLAQFEYDPEKYAQAKAEFAKKQTEKEFQEKQKAETQKQYRERLVSDWEKKVDGAEDKYDDFREVVGEITPDTPWTAAIFEADNGADIAYYLGKNPTEAERIAKLPPLSQVREIGKIEAKLLTEPPKAAAPSKAPAPIAPLKGTGNTASDEPSESDEIGRWMEKRNKKVYSRRR